MASFSLFLLRVRRSRKAREVEQRERRGSKSSLFCLSTHHQKQLPTADACGATCQPRFSSPHSPCARNAGAQPPPAESLPFVGTGAVCGDHVARCETGCCNQVSGVLVSLFKNREKERERRERESEKESEKEKERKRERDRDKQGERENGKEKRAREREKEKSFFIPLFSIFL
jgi:hypothetical protein